MNDKRDFDRAVDQWLDDGSDVTPPEVIDAVLLAVRSTPQERDFRVPWRTTSMTSYLRVAAVIALVVIASTAAISTFGPAGFGFGATSASPSPSPVLIARGNFIEHDFGRVEFEATRAGSTVTGHMTVGDKDSGPFTVDVQCVRTTDDGHVIIGGSIRVGNQTWPEGTLASIALRRGSPDRAMVSVADPRGPEVRTTDCLAYLDAKLQRYRNSGEWVYHVLGGTVEFGP